VKIGSICCLCVVGVLFHSTRKKHLCRDKLKPEFVADLRSLISCETITTAQNILAPNVAIPLDDVMMVTGLTRLSEGEFEYFLGTKEEADALGAEGYTLQSLIHEVVRSVPFQMRRGENDQRLGKKLIETIGQ